MRSGRFTDPLGPFLLFLYDSNGVNAQTHREEKIRYKGSFADLLHCKSHVNVKANFFASISYKCFER